MTNHALHLKCHAYGNCSVVCADDYGRPFAEFKQTAPCWNALLGLTNCIKTENKYEERQINSNKINS